MMNSKCQLMLHIAISIGAWLSIYLALSLLIYKEEKLTVSDFIETFSGISMLIHGVQRTASLHFNKSKIRELLELAANSFWSPDTIKLSPEVMEYAKRYHYRLKWVYRLFFVSCIFNTLEFCYRTFFVDEDILVIQYWKPDWMPFYPFWLFQVLVMNFGVMFPIICLDTLIMTILVLTQIQFKLLSDELENLFSSKNTRQSKENLAKVVKYHDFLISYIVLFNETFSGSLLSYMGIIVVSLCVEMYNLSSGADFEVFLRAAFYVIAALFQFIVFYCIPAQNLKDEADNLRNSAYNSKWYIYKPEATPQIQLVICQGQREVIITAGQVLDINLSTSLS
ncbi:unnamed protein product, partial [Callosobruchus maculatus]